VKRLVSAWEHGILDEPETVGEAVDPSMAVAVEPVRRGGTRLTKTQVDQIRTLYSEGISAPQLARRFGVHRATIHRKLQ